METEIKKLSDVFEIEDFIIPDNLHLQKGLANESFLVFTAKAGDKIVGGLTAYVLNQYYSEKPLAYIYDLAVLTPYQRKGIGKKLMKSLAEYCGQNGFEEVYVQAEAVDEDAIEFYRATRPTGEENVVHFYYTLN